MRFVDLNDDSVLTLSDLKAEWETFRAGEPENHASDFKTELFEILMATINGRNDLEIAGPTPAGVSRIIERLRNQIRKGVSK